MGGCVGTWVGGEEVARGKRKWVGGEGCEPASMVSRIPSAGATMLTPSALGWNYPFSTQNYRIRGATLKINSGSKCANFSCTSLDV